MFTDCQSLVAMPTHPEGVHAELRLLPHPLLGVLLLPDDLLQSLTLASSGPQL